MPTPPTDYNSIQNERNQVSIFLLTILQAVINEQIQSKQLEKHVGKYLYDSVKQYAKDLGYLPE
jgi:hypothetical protein